MADEKQQASASERDALEPTTSSQETVPASTRDAPEPATSRTQETKEQQAPASEWDALEPTTSHGGTHLNPPCNQCEPPVAASERDALEPTTSNGGTLGIPRATRASRRKQAKPTAHRSEPRAADHAYAAGTPSENACGAEASSEVGAPWNTTKHCWHAHSPSPTPASPT